MLINILLHTIKCGSMSGGKLIRISKETHKKLYSFKIELGVPTLDDTINYLFRFVPRRP
jgi:hypothetical protein